MKRILSLVLALVLCVGLCACGESEPENKEPIAMQKNETIQTENYELCVVGSRFCVRGPLAIEPLEGDPDNGAEEVFCVVYFGVKNIGKEEISVPSSIVGSLSYKDGYEFSANSCSELKSCNWTGASSSVPTSDDRINETLTTMKPLSPAKMLAVMFVVPREVMENEGEPAALNLEVEGQKYTYDLRTDANLLKKETEISELATDVLTQYQEAWLIRNISDCLDTLHEDVMFVWNYAGNVNSAGQHKWSEEFMSRLTVGFDLVFEQMSLEEIATVLPETAAALEQIQADCEGLRGMLEEMSATNNAAYVEPIEDLAWDIMTALVDLEKSDEIRKYGNF